MSKQVNYNPSMFFRLIGVAFLIVFILSLFVFAQIPAAEKIRGCIETKMNHVSLCPKSKSYTPLVFISSHLQHAILQTEDAAFYQHEGFDLEELAKSARLNWAKGGYKRGGSTITQQLAKNMFLNKDKTITRKLIEAAITLKIEKTLKKKEILERYLNVVEFGPNVYGVKQASEYYFNKTPMELTPLDSAFLAMLLPNPKKYSQSYFQKNLTPFAKRRLRQILFGMFKTGRISEQEYRGSLISMNHLFRAGADGDLEIDDLVPENIEADESSESGNDDELEIDTESEE